MIGAAEHVLAGGPAVVAVSGGADSAAALWACASVADVAAIHIDHGWPASAQLRRSALAIAEAVGVSIRVIEVNAGTSEGDARQARYRALAIAGGPVVTAHTADDVAETVLANLGRGAGAAGQTGIPAARPGVLRPFLQQRRADLRELADLLGLPWLDDPANVDPTYTRVRLRAMVRDWERAMARPVVATLERNTRVMADEDRFVEERSAGLGVFTDDRVVALWLAPLVTAPEALARRAIRRAVRAIDGMYAGSSAVTEAILEVARGGPPVEVAGGIRIRRRRGRLELCPPGSRDPAVPAAVPIAVPGRVRFGPWTIELRATDEPPIVLSGSRRTEVFDQDTVQGPLRVEAASAAHRLLMGGGGHKAALDALAERGFDEEERSGWPVLVDESGGPMWIPDVRRAALGWVSGDTRRYLVATASQEERWTPVEY